MADTAARTEVKVRTEYVPQLFERCARMYYFECCLGESSANSNPLRFITGGEDSVVTDFSETGRQDMQHESPYKLSCRHRHGFLSVITVVTPRECDFAIFQSQDTMIGDGDAVGVASQIRNDLFGVFERRLTISDPIFLI